MSFPSLTAIYHNDTYPAISPTRPELSQQGKVVVITGGGGGIGAATALAFATAGAKAVAILGRTQSTLDATAKSIQTAVPKTIVLSVIADLTDEAQTNAAFEKIGHKFGKIDVFVSNAGLLGVTNPIASSVVEKYWHVFEINTKGPLIAVQAFLRFASPDAIVIDVSSGLAHVPAVEGYSAYQASKLATVKIFDCLQAENPGLTVFNLQPAVVRTGIQTAERVFTSKDEFVEYSDTVELPAHFMVWLASLEAKFLKGKFVWANWDVDELKSRKEEIENTCLMTVRLDGWPFEE